MSKTFLIWVLAACLGAMGLAAYFVTRGAPASNERPRQLSDELPALNAPASPATPSKATPPPTSQPAAAVQSPAQNALANAAAGDANVRGEGFRRIVDKGVVRASVESPSRPFFSVENGASTGFNVDFMSLLFAQPEFTAKHAQIVLDPRPVDTYPQVPQALLAKDSRGSPVADIAIDGLTFSDEDLPGVVYTLPYIDDFGYALIAKKGSGLDAKSMAGKRVGVLKGDPDVAAYAAKAFPRSRLVELSDAAIQGQRSWIDSFIQKGAVDAVVYGYPFAVAEIAGSQLEFVQTKLPGSEIRYKVGVRSGDQELLEKLNVAISRVRQSSAYAELIKKYFASQNAAPVAKAVAGESSYVVKPGDTLSKIAAALMGDSAAYSKIQARNNIANPNLISVGQSLLIPAH